MHNIIQMCALLTEKTTHLYCTVMDYSKTQTARYNIHAPAVTRDMGTKVQSVTL